MTKLKYVNKYTTPYDDLRQTVSTQPLIEGGSNFKLHFLKETSDSKVIFEPTIGAILFVILFVVVGIALTYTGMNNLFDINNSKKLTNVFMTATGLICALAGVYFSISILKPRVFDKNIGLYYKTFKSKSLLKSKTKIKDLSVPLKSIVAIQIIGEHIEGDSDSAPYSSFELNLVITDNTRRNVIDHGNLRSVVADSEILSDFLKVPIWHATSHVD